MMVKIVLQYYAGTRSLYIQEGRQDKGRKTAPRDGARGLSHVRTPPPVRHVRTPPPVRHLRTPIILTLPLVRKMQRNTGEKETKSSDASLKLVTV